MRQHFLVVWDLGRYQRGAEIDSRVRKQYFVRARTRSPGHVVMNLERARPAPMPGPVASRCRDGKAHA